MYKFDLSKLYDFIFASEYALASSLYWIGNQNDIFPVILF